MSEAEKKAPKAPKAKVEAAPAGPENGYKIVGTLCRSQPTVVQGQEVDGKKKADTINADIVGYEIAKVVDGVIKGVKQGLKEDIAVFIASQPDFHVLNAKAGATAGDSGYIQAYGGGSLKADNLIKVIFDENGQLKPEYAETFKDIKAPKGKKGTGNGTGKKGPNEQTVAKLNTLAGKKSTISF